MGKITRMPIPTGTGGFMAFCCGSKTMKAPLDAFISIYTCHPLQSWQNIHPILVATLGILCSGIQRNLGYRIKEKWQSPAHRASKIAALQRAARLFWLKFLIISGYTNNQWFSFRWSKFDIKHQNLSKISWTGYFVLIVTIKTELTEATKKIM